MITKSPNNRKKLAIVVSAILLLVIGTVAFTELTDRTYLFHDRVAEPGIIPSTTVPSETPAENNSDDATNSEDQAPSNGPKEGDSTSASPSSGAAPIAPFGNFVSNHFPNLDGDPRPSTVTSVCNTTTGATCTIEFTNENGVVKSLAAQKTDGNGTTYWNWDVDDAGFTVGTWKVKAIATLNGQTVATEDTQNLEVGP